MTQILSGPSIMVDKLYFEHLKNFSSSEGYWSTTDCIEVAKDILKVTKSKAMLEIGFNIGYSASVWLDAGIETLAIIDINTHRDTYAAILATNEAYPQKNITWLLKDSTSEEAKNWTLPDIDIAFIDGGHDYATCMSDSLLSITRKAKWLVFDDVIESSNNGVWQVISNLEKNKKISIENKYPMTWVGNGNVVLSKVLV